MTLPPAKTTLSCPACYADFSRSWTVCESCGADADHRWLGYVLDRLPYPSYPPTVGVESPDETIDRMLSIRRWTRQTEIPGSNPSRDLVVSKTNASELAALRHDGFAVLTSESEIDDSLGEVVTVRPEPVLHASAMQTWAIDPEASIRLARPKRPGYPVLPPPFWAPLRSSRRWPTNDPAPATDDLTPPVFVIGAPRSGTTYLGQVLRRHPQILLTNETRMMVLFSRVLNQLCTDEWALLGHAPQFVDHLDKQLPDLIWSFYESLGAKPGMRWGDKYPHYADMRSHPHALVTIDRIFPQAQFIHIIRDPRDVVGSIARKGWVPEPQAWDVWARHVVHAREFGRIVGPERFFEIRYEELISDGVDTVTKLLDFLGLSAETAVLDFLREQDIERTPFSLPTTDVTSLGEKSSAGQAPDPEVPGDMTTLLLQTHYGD